MLVAVNLPNYGTLGTRESVVSIAETAEALGYESVWTTDHVLVPNSLPSGFFGNLLESLITLTFIAARTERIRIGTGILVLPQRDPILVAKQVATLQHLSAGRLSVAVAVGYVEQEYELLRSSYTRRGALLDEYLPALRELLEAQDPTFHGDTITFQDVYFSPRPLTRVPLFVGGSSAASLRRAAALGDGWYALKQTPEQIALRSTRSASTILARALRRRCASPPGSAARYRTPNPGRRCRARSPTSPTRQMRSLPPELTGSLSSRSRATSRTSLTSCGCSGARSCRCCPARSSWAETGRGDGAPSRGPRSRSGRRRRRVPQRRRPGCGPSGRRCWRRRRA